MSEEDVRTYLQMLSPEDLRPARGRAVRLEVRELDRWSPLVREMTLGIGCAHQWPACREFWLHTSSHDHAHALPNYERRGFRRCQV